MNVDSLPAINASLNGVATLLLIGGFWAIKFRNDRDLHKKFMAAALVCSALFLSCYLYYHYNAGAMTPFEKQGAIRVVYFTILITHIPLAALMTPFILAAVWFALRGQFDRHKMIVKWVWPVWIYVSITGVLIYLMLYRM
ncbi:MAG: DUF420 domain-containing protein [Candidatus Hydrogenedentes bacterium]|nr:DUF420 domain-containing protein [Candidatus Hydrogenedentota bacterium]